MKSSHGLRSDNRNLLVLLLFVILLIWGPIEPYGMAFRVGYLVTLPTLLWFILGYFGSKWNGDELANERLARGITGIIAGALFVGAYLSFTAPYHTECTRSVPTRDGSECVGDYIGVKGGDLWGTFILVVLGALATWYSISKHDNSS